MTTPTRRIRIDTEALGQAQRGPDAAADYLDAALSTLRDVIASVGDCWGEDSAGKSFAENYVGTAQDTQDAATEMVKACHAIAQVIDQMSSIYAATDESASQKAAELNAVLSQALPPVTGTADAGQAASDASANGDVRTAPILRNYTPAIPAQQDDSAPATFDAPMAPRDTTALRRPEEPVTPAGLGLDPSPVAGGVLHPMVVPRDVEPLDVPAEPRHIDESDTVIEPADAVAPSLPRAIVRTESGSDA